MAVEKAVRGKEVGAQQKRPRSPSVKLEEHREQLRKKFGSVLIALNAFLMGAGVASVGWKGHEVARNAKLRIQGSSLKARIAAVEAAHESASTVSGEWVGLKEDEERLHSQQERPGVMLTLRARYDTLMPAQQDFLQAAGIAPEGVGGAEGRYAGLHPAIVSRALFECKGEGFPPYVLAANTKAFWIRSSPELREKYALYLPLLPDTPEVRRGIEENIIPGFAMIPGATHTTNSWGLRGPEPNLEAPLRVMVLGDSYMHGWGVGDADAPPQRLAEHLRGVFQQEVSVLNAGVAGYGPRQYLQQFEKHVARFRPHAVVVSVCGNDDMYRGEEGWKMAGHYINKIIENCRDAGIYVLVCPVPEEGAMSERNMDCTRNVIEKLRGLPGSSYCNMIDEMMEENMRLTREQSTETRTGSQVSVDNQLVSRSRFHIEDDGHLNEHGANFWGKAVAKRLYLLIP